MGNACSSRNIYKNDKSINSEQKKEKTYFNCYYFITQLSNACLFNQEYEFFVNMRNYDRIAQYYEQVDSSDED